MGHDGDVLVGAAQAPGRRFGFWLADPGLGMQDLAVQVRELDVVSITDVDLTDASYGQVYGALALLQAAGVGKVGLMSDPAELGYGAEAETE